MVPMLALLGAWPERRETAAAAAASRALVPGTIDLNRKTGRGSVVLSCPSCFAAAAFGPGDPVNFPHARSRCDGTPFVQMIDARRAGAR